MTDEPNNTPTLSDPRRHDLDALRATAMLLGIALHAALSFMDIPWIVRDKYQSPVFDVFFAATHAFRMPLFFLLSGFFSAMLLSRRGLKGLLWQRTKRIVFPLLLGCVTIIPIMWITFFGVGSLQSVRGSPSDTGKDIWTASAYGDLEAVRRHVGEGASLDAPDPVLRTPPLGWAVIGDHVDVVEYLLEAGADPSARYGDNNTAMHTAAFFGRAAAAELLLDAGADPRARNNGGETPLNALRPGKGTTEFIAGFLNVPIDFAAVSEGREQIRPMIERSIAASEPGSGAHDAENWDARKILGAIVLGLMQFPFFHHLWFLWFLCWLTTGYALVVTVSRRLPSVRIPSVLVATPVCMVWLIPLTMLTQWLQTGDGGGEAFGPDTSAGLLPMPRVLAHYAVFFGFGVLVYGQRGAADRLGRAWWIQLPLAFVLLPAALGLTHGAPWAVESIADDGARLGLAILSQVLFAWLMIFGLMGLFEAWLSRERRWVRYVSDSSYWLYLVHLPPILIGQALLRNVELPAIVKFMLLTVVTTAILLVTYRLFVRYTPIGWLLNGPRTRPSKNKGESDGGGDRGGAGGADAAGEAESDEPATA